MPASYPLLLLKTEFFERLHYDEAIKIDECPQRKSGPVSHTGLTSLLSVQALPTG